MKSALKATALLGSSSLITIALGVLTAKVWARLIGPQGYGHMGLLQSSVTLFAIVAELGLATTIVRQTAFPIASGDKLEVHAIWRSAVVILLPALLLIGIVLVVFRAPLAGFLLGDNRSGTVVLWVIPMLFFGVSSNLRTGLINAHHQVKALAATNVALNIIGTLTSLALIIPFGISGIAPSLALGAVVRWIFVTVVLWKTTGLLFPKGRVVAHHVRELLRHGVPVTASMIVGPGVQFLLPVIVLHLVNKNAVGHYQAANSIAITLIGFMLTAVGHDYYPRVSAARGDVASLRGIAQEQHRLLLLLGTPLLLGIKWGIGWAVPYLLSSDFLPVIDILSWHLLGELLRFSSVSFAYVVLVRFSGLAFFVPALINGVVIFLCTITLVPIFGIKGVGMAFSISHLVYLVIVAVQVRSRLGWGLGRDVRFLLIGLLALVLPTVLPPTMASQRSWLEFIFAGCATVFSASELWRKWQSAKDSRKE